MDKNQFVITLLFLFAHSYIFINFPTRKMNFKSIDIVLNLLMGLIIFKNNLKLKKKQV